MIMGHCITGKGIKRRSSILSGGYNLVEVAEKANFVSAGYFTFLLHDKSDTCLLLVRESRSALEVR